jgi:phosphatidyl-myo-inositol dimannoside synthase
MNAGIVCSPGMRIFALVTDAFGGQGGIAQYNRDFLSALADCDDVGEVIVLPRTTTKPPDMTPSGVRQLRPVKGRIAYSLAAIWSAWTSKPIDLIFCGHLFMTPLAAGLAKLLRVPLWVQVHGTDAWEELSRLQCRAIESATLVTSVSRYTRQRLLQWIAIDPVRVKVLPNTVDPRFCPGPKPQHLVERYGLEKSKVLLTVSRIVASERYKGHDRVIRALRRVLAEHPETIYLIVGDGDDRVTLESLAAECGVADAVRFVGQVPPDELPDYFRLADVFVMPSTGEGFGIVFLEAIATGVPVIAGSKDGSRDPLCDGASGTLVEPENLDELVAAIHAALINSSPARTAADGERFGLDRFAHHITMLLGQIPRVGEARKRSALGYLASPSVQGAER